jgi:hypothetical protein
MRKLVVCICLLSVNTATAVPPGFAKRTLPLDAPPVGLAFDADGVLYALEGAAFNDNVATMRVILPNGTFGASFSVVGDDSSNFFVGAMAYDPISDRLLITDNTADGRLYAVGKTGGQTTISAGLAGAAGVAVRSSGEIFVSTSPFFAAGEVLQIDRANGDATSVLGNLGYGAGLVFDLDGYLVVQDANTSTFQGRLQRLPVSETSGGLTFGTPVPLVENMQSSAGITIDGEGDMFTTGAGGLYEVAGSPLAETMEIRFNLQPRSHLAPAHSRLSDLPARTAAGLPIWPISDSPRRTSSSRFSLPLNRATTTRTASSMQAITQRGAARSARTIHRPTVTATGQSTQPIT